MERSKSDSTIKSKTKILCEMDQERFESVIADVNEKIEDLFDDLKKVDKGQVEVSKRVDEVEEKNISFLGNLRNHLNRSDQTISKLKNHLTIANEDHIKENYVTKELDELEKKYTEMREQMTKDIEKLEKEFAELVLYYGPPDDLPRKIDEQKSQMEVQEAQHKEKIALMKKYFISQQNTLNEVFEKRLQDMSSKFQDQYQICTAGYSERKLNELKEKEANEKDFAGKEDLGDEKNFADEDDLADEKDFADENGLADEKDLSDETDIK